MRRISRAFVLIACSVALAGGQQTGVQFDVVSIKINPNIRSNARPVERPDGGFRLTNVPVMTLIARAYPPAIPAEMVGLPDWAKSERYDVSATSSLERATAEDRVAMLRTMLSERFKLAVHFEQREQDTFDLVLARRDGKLGPGLTQSTTECNQVPKEPPSASQAASTLPDFSQPPPPCTARTADSTLRPAAQAQLGDVLEGDAPMATLAEALRFPAGRRVVDKTGLAGSYRFRLNFDSMAARRPPNVAPPPDAAPSVFIAMPEQLGLKLVPSRTPRDTLIVDHLERPTPN
jgi:uncharacterized protein (TIGR03435 family)